MGRFQATVSTVAALTTIFAAGATGWKLAQPQQPVVDDTDKAVRELREKLTAIELKSATVTPAPTAPPQPTVLPEQPVDTSETVAPPQPPTP